MTLSIHYQKRKNLSLFQNLIKEKELNVSYIQNYIPIYKEIFALNENNFNSINLNHLWYISDINSLLEDSVLDCNIKNINTEEMNKNVPIFVKMAPLLDPFKYIIGKYNHNDVNLFNIPNTLSMDNYSIHPKILDTNNSAYIDGLFAYLSSKLLHTPNNNFCHGIDFYGSFLATKNDFKLNIIDDLDYLIKSDFFNAQKNILFQIPDYEHLIEEEIIKLPPITIGVETDISSINIEQIEYENLNENKDMKANNDNDNHLIEIKDNHSFIIEDNHITTLKSNSTTSSRSSYTEMDNNSIHIGSDDCNCENEDIYSSNDEEDDEDEEDEEEEDEEDDDEDDDNEEEEEKLNIIIPTFPIHMICLENCYETLDNLIIKSSLSKDEWFSAFMQIIMTLLTYQKIFHFTHNDLHTNNIMYIKTNKPYLYYLYKKKYYKVPTFGRIFKIIDFGRSIFKFNNKVFCSDSFQAGGDASSQYNIEPFFNDKKPRLEPNYSFDLCRLACSIFDYVVEDIENITEEEKVDPVVKLITEWCTDDNGINVLYKTNGTERYPDFKLYKMIARFVHKHTPQQQLEREEFMKYIIYKTALPKDSILINIDDFIK